MAEARARLAAHEEKAAAQAATIHEQAEHNRSLEVELCVLVLENSIAMQPLHPNCVTSFE